MVAAGHIPWQGLHLLRTAEGGRSEFKFIQGRHHPVGLGSSNQSPLSPSSLPASVDPILSLKASSARSSVPPRFLLLDVACRLALSQGVRANSFLPLTPLMHNQTNSWTYQDQE